MRQKILRKKIRHLRIRKRVEGTTIVPRLAIFRSNKHIYAQIIDDESSKTIVQVSDIKLKRKEEKKTDLAKLVGLEIAKRGITKKVTKVAFDRGGYKYHGRVKALAEGAREGGLSF